MSGANNRSSRRQISILRLSRILSSSEASIASLSLPSIPLNPPQSHLVRSPNPSITGAVATAPPPAPLPLPCRRYAVSMDFTAPSFSLGIDFDDPPPAPAARSELRGQARGYAAPDPPSFSLGFDDDGGGGDEPQLPAGGRSEGLARRYEAPDAPSFSLGFDDDDDDGGASEPEFPAGGRREEQARRYEAPDPPSFSLGFEEDDGGAGEPQFPAGGRRVEQARRYEAPDPPSFSLGFDDDDDGGGGRPGEPHLPARSRREEQPRRYEAPDAPSFSLGFNEEEDDFVAGGRCHEQPRTQVAPGHLSCLDDEDEEFLLSGCRRPDPARGKVLHPDPVQPETSRLKRLRRGPAPRPMAPPPPPPPSAPAPLTTEASPGTAAWGDIGSIEDEIEGSTDDEQPRGMPPSVGSCRTPSNSKFSLLSQSVLTTQSTRKAKITKYTPSSSSVLSKPLEESCTKKLLPKITISPLRKIHFLDSDTDSDNKSLNKAKKPVSPIKKRQASMYKYVQKKHTLQQNSKSEGSSVAQKNKDNTSDSWATPALDDFCSEYVQKKHTLQKNNKSEGSSVVQKNKDNMNDSWATPALDDFCSEYFQSVQDSRPSQQKEINRFSGSKVPRPYNSVSEIGEHFQHESSSSRPVPEENLTDSHPPAMHYFFHHDQMIQKLVRERLQHFVPMGAETSQGNEYGVEETLNYRNHFGQSGDANGRWVTPNQTTSFPTDFGKRRVHAGGTQSGSGHWFTGEDGRKVYISKDGQELSGRGAYRQYRKESGKGFRKFKKKGAVKKEGSAVARRGSAAANKASSSAKRSSAAKRKR